MWQQNFLCARKFTYFASLAFIMKMQLLRNNHLTRVTVGRAFGREVLF